MAVSVSSYPWYNKDTLAIESLEEGACMTKRWVFFLAMMLAVCQAIHAEEPWTFAKEGEGIRVYTRSVPGSSANEFMGVADVKAPLEVVIEVFKDIPSFPQWYGFCKEIRLLRQDGEFHRLIYFVLETMGPVKDRDMIVDVKDTRALAAGKTVIVMNALKDEIVPPTSTYVRMTEMKGSCVLTRVDSESTHVVYTVKADPAGYIPAFISNMIQKDQPYLTLKGLREMVKKDVYWRKAGLERKP